MPLSMHAWARPAAEGAACSQLQSANAFWGMHDDLFHHQTEITNANLKDKLIEYARGNKDLDLPVFKDCLENQLSLGLVLRGLNLASSNQVDSTPTIFINGRRIPGAKDIAQLREVIQDAKDEKRSETSKRVDPKSSATNAPRPQATGPQ